MSTKIVGWNCSECQTFWQDTTMGGKPSIRYSCPFDGSPRDKGRKIVLILGKETNGGQDKDSHLPKDE